jgi:hypothetical protein
VAYFKSHARRGFAAIALGPGAGGGPVVRAIVDWLRAGRRAEFSERDLKQARRWITPDDLAEALDYLVERGVIRRHDDDDDGGLRVGRPPSPSYEVNPALLDTRNPQNLRNPPAEAPPVGPSEDSEDFEGFEYARRIGS